MSDVWDIVIIGGGVSGLGVAKAAEQKQLKTLLIEASFRCGKGTSDNSLRIMHGGFRYLQTGNVLRVWDSVGAQSELYRMYPDLVTPIPCVMPLDAVGLKSAPFAKIGLIAYDIIAKMRGVKIGHGSILDRDETYQRSPILRGHAEHGSLLWWDGILRDSDSLVGRIKEEFVHTTLKVSTRVNSVRRDGAYFSVVTAHETFKARSVVNTAGPWIKELRPHMPEIPDHYGHHWAAGFNVVLEGSIDQTHGIAVRSKEGRLFFAVPRTDAYGNKLTALGTGYILHEGDPSHNKVSEEIVLNFVKEFSGILPEAEVLGRKIMHVEVGLLPLRRPEPNALVGAVKISGERGYFEVLSTKYTTFLPQGRAVMRDVSAWLKESV